MKAKSLRFDEQVLELDAARARTSRSMMLSAGLHVLLLLLLVMVKPAEHQQETLTEITLLGPDGLEAAGDPAPAPAATAPQSSAGAIVAVAHEEHFRRDPLAASVDPVPQSDTAVLDRMNARLAAIQGETATPLASGPAMGAPRSALTTPAAAAGPGGDGGSPISLHRGGGSGSSPLALARGGGSALVPATATGGMPGTGTGASAPAVPQGGDAAARRTLAGASIAGPIADRTILHYVTPEYPDWAKHDGVEATVTLYFVVRADGTIKENVMVQKTAGFGDFDDNARVALREWRFEPLGGGRTGEQWGTITFHYRLRGA